MNNHFSEVGIDRLRVAVIGNAIECLVRAFRSNNQLEIAKEKDFFCNPDSLFEVYSDLDGQRLYRLIEQNADKISNHEIGKVIQDFIETNNPIRDSKN